MKMSESVTYIAKGYRDVIWCPYLNEPAIIQYKTVGDKRVAYCPNCDGNYEPETHEFICHIQK